MSARKIRRARELAERKRLERAARHAARQMGCVCGPRVEVTKLRERHHGVRIFHAEFCPLLRSYEGADPDVPTGPIMVVPDDWEPAA
jgi:hypothetical protein